MYSAQLLDHFENPRGVGDLANASVSVELQNPACGDVLRLSLLVDQGRIVDARFRAKGCVPAIACGSWLTQAIEGKAVPELAAISAEQIETGLGGLPAASHHASTLAIAALGEALDKLGR